jgi:acyl-coenzyme A thioesterase PaaI-like protein
MSSPAANKTPISVARFNELLSATIPTAGFFNIQAEVIEPGVAILRLPYSDKLLRPGSTHAGPSMMTLIDLAMYAAVLSLDSDCTSSLTTQLSVNFLERPPATDLLAECCILGADDLSAVGRVSLFPHNDPTNIVCTATCTYAIPRSRRP